MRRTIPTPDSGTTPLLVAAGLVPPLSPGAAATARPACQGVTATIVGTTGDDRLAGPCRGT